ncbi:c-type cytochrome domain-containing protein [Roseiconus lacunae]|uniref:WD40 domain-containing protein n=1 Tax=Roseiconus lacunae TaxID=2605694 RepID=UPI0030914B06|nr:c-type cytochrome domain-containing protein [Stieleria sp. HD01]
MPQDRPVPRSFSPRSVWLFVLSFACLALPSVRNGHADDQIDYVNDVLPIFETHCIGCHNADGPEGGFAMDSFETLLRGGESGIAITPGTSSSSRLLLLVTGKMNPIMPPDGEDGPSEKEVETLTRWIDQGAPGPQGDLPIKRKLRTPDIKASENVAKPITAIAVAPDQSRTAFATFQSVEIRTDDVTTFTIEDDDLGKVNSLAFSKDATRILVGSGLTGAYGRAAIYRTDDGTLEQEFVGHRDTLYAAVFSPDESLIATAGYDQAIVLWDARNGEVKRELNGHNGAIFDLAFSPDGKVLASACADETAKLWNVATGKRLDTLGQPEGEVTAIDFSRDGRFVIATSADNRLRVWQLRSIEQPQINPLIATRFIDETPLTNFALSPDEQLLVVLVQSGNIKVLSTKNWQTVASLESLSAMGTDLAFAADGDSISVATIDGNIVRRNLPTRLTSHDSTHSVGMAEKIYLDLPAPTSVSESKLRDLAGENVRILDVGRSVSVEGEISDTGQADFYRWPCHRGEVWAIDADAVSDSRLDPIVTIFDEDDRPVQRVRLQAIRDSYFTFRGKDSEQSNDFRVFNWQEMNLGQYFYAAGEVTRLMMHPRGPDSGFNVYPGQGQRWTYFGTSGTTHALGEPAYIVRPLGTDEPPLANGLPVFELTYENDDDPMRSAGKNSRLVFVAPRDATYTVRITDTRREGGENYAYRLTLRAASPGFRASTGTIKKPLRPATGREFSVNVDRLDGFQGPVTFEIEGLPDQLVSNFPLTVEAGLKSANGVIWAPPGLPHNESDQESVQDSDGEVAWSGLVEPKITAWAMINGKRVERPAGTIGKLSVEASTPQVIPSIHPIDGEIAKYEDWVLPVKRGETVSARVQLDRKASFVNEVSFGKEFSGRNATQGVYVDNIGLNGLLIVRGASQREFFITADPTAKPGRRSFFLTANVDGGLCSHPITVEVK